MSRPPGVMNCPFPACLRDTELEEKKQTDLTQFVQLHEGDDLTISKASKITRSCVTRFITLAGAAESGKTTLLASIYECFQKGGFADYYFAGSLTLPGYEKRCHLSRIESGLSESVY